MTTCRWNGLDTGREVEIAEEHVSAFAGEIELGLIRRVEAPAGPNVVTASDYLASQGFDRPDPTRGTEGPNWQDPTEAVEAPAVDPA